MDSGGVHMVLSSRAQHARLNLRKARAPTSPRYSSDSVPTLPQKRMSAADDAAKSEENEEISSEGALARVH